MLGALFSITEPFDEPYIWTWDTQEYPWTLNLVKPETQPTAEVRFGKNLAEIEREVDPSNIVNRLYPLGYGEGVNQLDITRVNNGVPYIENPASIAEYGLQSYVWVDRRFEDADSLYASAKKFLAEWSVPKVTYRIKAVDLSLLTGLSIDKFRTGKVIRVIDPEIGTFDARIVNERKADIIEAPYDVELEISNKADGIGTTLADIERRQEINEVYAQGATNLLIYQYEDNADNQHPAVIRFKLPDEMVRINKLELTYETTAFRAYSKATHGGGAVVKSTSSGGGTTRTTSSGGGSTVTSSSGGGTSTSTQSGGGSSQTSAAGGDHRHLMFRLNNNIQGPTAPNRYEAASGGIAELNASSTDLYTAGSSGTHTHSVSIPAHSHNFTVPNHTHTVNIPNHTHSVEIPNHTHDIELPDHTHEIEHGIYKLNRTPSKVEIKVDGNTVPITSTSGDSIDLIPYLSLDSENRVTRGWHTVEITPNDLGRINAQLMVQFFMQSRGGVDA